MAAPPLAIGDKMIGVLKGTLFGQVVENTFHWRVTSVPTGYSLQDFVNEMVTDMAPEYALMLSRDWIGLAAYGRRVSPTPTRGIEKTLSPLIGDVAQDSLPPSVAAVISRFTNLPGQGGRGRIFIPAVPKTFQNGGLVNSTGLTIYTAFLVWLDLTWTSTLGATFEPVLLKPGNIAVDIEGTTLRNILRSQRRREIGVGI